MALRPQFDGFINGNLNYYKTTLTAGNVQTLVQANGYNGTTNVLGGTLTFKDFGTALNSATVNVNGATLSLDNTGLADIGQRIASGATMNLNGGTVAGDRPGGQQRPHDARARPSCSRASNIITGHRHQLNNAAGSETLTIGSLVRSAGATVNFTGTNLGLAPTTANSVRRQLRSPSASATNIMLTSVTDGRSPRPRRR